MAGITVKIGGVDKTEYVDARTLSIRDELTSKVNSASFDFICNNPPNQRKTVNGEIKSGINISGICAT